MASTPSVALAACLAACALLAGLPSASAYNNGIGRLPPMGWNVRPCVGRDGSRQRAADDARAKRRDETRERRSIAHRDLSPSLPLSLSLLSFAALALHSRRSRCTAIFLPWAAP